MMNKKLTSSSQRKNPKKKVKLYCKKISGSIEHVKTETWKEEISKGSVK